VRKALLVCGILASLLYLSMNVFIPMQWAGYSSAAQTISELSAIGAPTRPVWFALGVVYTLLIAAFGLGIWTASRGARRLRLAGALLVCSGLFGLFWPPMHLRGAGFSLTDTLHIAWTAVSLLITLVVMGLAAREFGRRFRLFTFAIVAIWLVCGTLTGLAGPRVAANLPTPWIGVWERINAAAYLLWLVVFAIALIRRFASPKSAGRISAQPVKTGGFVARGFEEVRAEFDRNFVERGEIGAAVAAYWRGEKVVDLWGGRRTPNGDAPWTRDTMVVVNSITKGLSAMTLAVANARGWLDYEAPVVRYWPEFAENGKAAITVRQLLGHEAGLVLLDEPLTLDKLRNLDYMARLLARQKPAWTPGTRHGYHTMTIGLYMQELIRRVDPAHRSLGRFFREEIAAPLGLEFYIGLPAAISSERLAHVKPLSPWRGLLALRYTPPAVTMRMIRPGSLLRRSFVGLDVDQNDRGYYEVEVPAGNGVGTARAIARAYSVFAEGGAELRILPQTLALITAPPVMAGARDVVLGVPSYFALGFLRPGPEVAFGSSPRAFGAPGAGGSFAFADPDAHLGYAYVMNKLDFYLTDDPREKALREALYRAIARAPAAVRAREGVAVRP
jgi:CubicO group peptidase (beta-lactamase class C family)